MSNICYITYQSFPSSKANTIQTMANLKYLIKNGNEVELIFPLREKNSSDNLIDLQSFYSFKENLKVTGTEHKYPFGKIQMFEKMFFIFSHAAWSRKVVKRVNKIYDLNTLFITRSEWVAYFLSKCKLNLVYECHQSSKIKSLLIPLIVKNKKSKVIFLNELLRESFNLEKEFNPQINVLHNGVDTEYFQENIKKEKNSIIFVGNLLRFNKDRNIEFLIESFKNNSSLDKYKLKLIGGPENERTRIDKLIFENNLNENIKTYGELSREDTILEIQKSEIGLLLNKSDNLHSTQFTSPLKYFEFLYGGLKVVGVDFPAHRVLPFAENILLFSEDNIEEFVNCINSSKNIESIMKNKLNSISLDLRVKKIIEIIQT